ncbi:hypothetical protein EV176_007569, partial [Coemansia sp. RSA 451]
RRKKRGPHKGVARVGPPARSQRHSQWNKLCYASPRWCEWHCRLSPRSLVLCANPGI